MVPAHPNEIVIYDVAISFFFSVFGTLGDSCNVQWHWQHYPYARSTCQEPNGASKTVLQIKSEKSHSHRL